MFIDIVIIVLLVAFTKISNFFFVVILITEMYGVFINHNYSPVVIMKCRYVFPLGRIIAVSANVIVDCTRL